MITLELIARRIERIKSLLADVEPVTVGKERQACFELGKLLAEVEHAQGVEAASRIEATNLRSASASSPE
jgi:hypothetical protein